MPRLLNKDEQTRAVELAVAAERAKRPDAIGISVFVDPTAKDDGTIGYHAVIRIDGRLPPTDSQDGKGGV